MLLNAVGVVTTESDSSDVCKGCWSCWEAWSLSNRWFGRIVV